jgi:hypothetical protein
MKNAGVPAPRPNTQMNSLMIAALLFLLAGCNAGAQSPGRLQVADGQFVLDDRPARAIGVNYFEAFTWALSIADGSRRTASYEEVEIMGHVKPAGSLPAKKSFREGFRVLQQKGIPFVRFNCGGFFPKDWRLYREDPAAYFRLLDDLVRAAEEHDLGLIPSLFWSFFTVPGIVGEPLNAWGDTGSKTHAFMRKYTQEVVGRYKDSSAIWGWEFGNEYNLEVDLPDRQREELARWFQPKFGMPAKPGPDDHLTSQDIRTAYREFARGVREIDPLRPIFTGDAAPRSAAATLEATGNWGVDTREQWIAQLVKNNPDPVDTISIHFYPFHTQSGVGLKDRPPEETLDASLAAAREAGKPLWVGEWAASETSDPALRREQFQTVLDLLVEREIQLSAVWVFDFPWQPLMNIDVGTENEFMLDALAEANRRLNRKDVGSEAGESGKNQ